MEQFEFVIRKRPLSLQARHASLQQWKHFVGKEAAKAWPAGRRPVQHRHLRLTIVYLCADAPADTDNIIKPIQDALVGLVYYDDILVSDVDSHTRFISDPLDLAPLPPLLQTAAMAGHECVYVRVSDAQDLGSYL